MRMFKDLRVTSKDMGENLRTYSRLLTAQLKDKEEELIDLKNRFTKLHKRFTQLDYAFKKNLELHQRQIIEIHELRNSQKELRKVNEDRRNEFRKLNEQLMRVTNEKEVAKNGLTHWRQVATDEKKFHQGKYEEFVTRCNFKLQEDRTVLQNRFKEAEMLAQRRIQELINLRKVDEEKAEAIGKKVIVLQGDVDVLRYRTEELARLFQALPQINKNFKTIGSRIVEVLKSFSLSHAEYEGKLKELHGALIEDNSVSTIAEKIDIDSDYESLKNQNLVLREVVKKLKNDLAQIKKTEVTVPDREGENLRKNRSIEEELVQRKTDVRKLENLITEKDEELRKFERENKNLRIIRENSCKSDEGMTVSKFVQTDKEISKYFDEREPREFRDCGSLEACWSERAESFEFNLGSMGVERSYGGNEVTVRNEKEVFQNIRTSFNPNKIEPPTRIRRHGRFDPVESHLNSIRYKEYTIPFSRRDNLKIRHPIAPIHSGEGIFRLRSVQSEEEYQSTPADEAVLYFDFENIDITAFKNVKSKLTNCSAQTVPIKTVNVSAQTTITSKENLRSLSGTGVKMLNSERRAIERGLRDLEKTVSEARKETLEEARALIVSSTKFPPSEEFFDCIRYLSQSCDENLADKN